MAEISVGKRAPQFSLKDFRGHSHPVAKEKGKYIVLYFYPKDDTPGCTVEAIQFSEHISAFKRRQVHVYGISGGDAKSKEKFCQKHDLKIPLLSDSDFAVSKKYDAYGKKSFMGRAYIGILRKTFVLDPHFRVLKIFDSVKPEGHADEVLEAIDALEAENVVHQPKHPNKTTRREVPRAKRRKAEQRSRDAQRGEPRKRK